MTTKDTPTLQVQQVNRLTADAYKHLVDQLPNPMISDSTSDLVAGQKLGIQLVLQKLREGFVIGA